MLFSTGFTYRYIVFVKRLTLRIVTDDLHEPIIGSFLGFFAIVATRWGGKHLVERDFSTADDPWILCNSFVHFLRCFCTETLHIYLFSIFLVLVVMR